MSNVMKSGIEKESDGCSTHIPQRECFSGMNIYATDWLAVSPDRNSESQLFDKVRGHDIKLLRYLSVRYICDLMVENKKVKFGLK